MPSRSDYKIADATVLAFSGAIFLVALGSLVYILLWRKSKQPRRRLNALWPIRTLLTIAIAGLAAVQVCRLYTLLWNPGSSISSSAVTDWTGQGWMCRIYISASLGIFFPYCCLFTLFALERGRYGFQELMERKAMPGWESSNKKIHAANKRIFVLSTLCTLPIALLQSCIAFVGVWATSKGKSPEEDPRSVMGYFFATYWQGSGAECSSFFDGTTESGTNECALCVFPAASVILYLVTNIPIVCGVLALSYNIIAESYNRTVRRRVRIFSVLFAALVLAGRFLSCNLIYFFLSCWWKNKA